MKKRHYIQALHLALAMLLIITVYLLFSLKGLGLYWLQWVTISAESAEVWFAINSGLFAGIIIYFLTTYLPVLLRRKIVKKEVQDAMAAFVSWSIQHLNNSKIIFKENEFDVLGPSELKEVNSQITYGATTEGRRLSIRDILLKIRGKRDDLKALHLMHYNHLMMDKISDDLEELTSAKLFGSGLRYFTYNQEDLEEEKIDIYSYLREFYVLANRLNIEEGSVTSAKSN